MPMRRHLPAQPNPNPNNKAFHQFEIANMLDYSITPIPCNDICLRSGRVVEPLVIKDVPSSVSRERMYQQYSSHTTIPIIEDVEHPTETPAETHREIAIEMQPTQLMREPPYPERLTLQKAVEQP